MIEDGGTTSLDSVEAVRRKLEESRTTGTMDLSVEDVVLLKAVSDYALQECPIEGGMERDDGSLISKA